MIRSIDTSDPTLHGKRVLLRACLNVPISGGMVTNSWRIERALPTIEALSEAGARVIVLAHIGDKPTDSLRPVWEEVQRRCTSEVRFVDDVVGAAARAAVATLPEGGILMLENVRRESGEKENSPVLAEALAAMADLYINDAFPDSHRVHASIVGVPTRIPSFAGPLFMEEYQGILPALTPSSPSLAIMGGAKFLTKEPLIHTLLEKYDHVFVGGALANDFFKAMGHEVGRSVVSHAPSIDALLKNGKLIIPTDVVVEGVDGKEVKSVTDVAPSDIIYDIGPRSVEALGPLITKARLILWNGPLGNFERGYREQTDLLARMVLEAPGQSVIGGGDTVASIQKFLNTAHKPRNFVSTAGGAMLQLIADGTLPSIEALDHSPQ